MMMVLSGRICLLMLVFTDIINVDNKKIMSVHLVNLYLIGVISLLIVTRWQTMGKKVVISI